MKNEAPEMCWHTSVDAAFWCECGDPMPADAGAEKLARERGLCPRCFAERNLGEASK